MEALLKLLRQITGAEITPVSGAGAYNFTPSAMSRALIDDYSAEVRPKQKAA